MHRLARVLEGIVRTEQEFVYKRGKSNESGAGSEYGARGWGILASDADFGLVKFWGKFWPRKTFSLEGE